jgi:hypothetical protein
VSLPLDLRSGDYRLASSALNVSPEPVEEPLVGAAQERVTQAGVGDRPTRRLAARRTLDRLVPRVLRGRDLLARLVTFAEKENEIAGVGEVGGKLDRTPPVELRRGRGGVEPEGHRAAWS